MDLWVGLAFGVVIGAIAGCGVCEFIRLRNTSPGFYPSSMDHKNSSALSIAEDSLAETPKSVEYSVDKPKHIPWRVRRAELEAQHRTKRRNIEQWRDHS